MAHILVVDDIPELIETEKELLQETGLDYRVSMAKSYERALELLEAEPFDLVILDLMLPDHSGVEILDHIKRKFKIPVMIYSAYLECVPPYLLMQKGADQVLAKPAPLHVFINAIKNLVESHHEKTTLTLHGFNLRQIKTQVLGAMINRVLHKTNCNIPQAALTLGISQACLARLIKRLKIATP